MGVVKEFVQLLLLFHVVKSENYNESCVNDFRDILNDEHIDVTKICKEKRCIAKCCPEGLIYYYTPNNLTCTTVEEISKMTNKSIIADYKKIAIYKVNTNGLGIQGKSDLNLVDNFKFVKNNKIYNDKCAAKIRKKEKKNLNLREDSSLVQDSPNNYWRWKTWNFDEFCMEFAVTNSKKGVRGPFPAYRLKINSNNVLVDNSTVEIYYAATLLVSFFFLLLVLFVYSAIRELRNLVGIVLMAYVSTLALAFLLQAIHKLMVHKTSTFCKSYSAINYYLTLSTFFWMNVMSLDIWWTFRGIFKSRPIHRRGEFCKFISYGLYAWGVPLLVTIAVVIIDNLDLSDYPDIFKPHFEFCLAMMYEQPELKYYMYMPCLALIILNWIFFLMTAFNIWRIRRSMNRFSDDSTKYKNNQNRFGLYLKLALVMGISWVLEVVDDMPRWLQITAVFYDNLLGVAIFFIFVFKRKILLMLCIKFGVKGRLFDNLQRNLQRNISNYSTTSASNNDRKQSNS